MIRAAATVDGTDDAIGSDAFGRYVFEHAFASGAARPKTNAVQPSTHSARTRQSNSFVTPIVVTENSLQQPLRQRRPFASPPGAAMASIRSNNMHVPVSRPQPCMRLSKAASNSQQPTTACRPGVLRCVLSFSPLQAARPLPHESMPRDDGFRNQLCYPLGGIAQANYAKATIRDVASRA